MYKFTIGNYIEIKLKQKSIIIFALLALSGVESRKMAQKRNTYLSESAPYSSAIESLASAPDTTVTEAPVVKAAEATAVKAEAAPIKAAEAAPVAAPVVDEAASIKAAAAAVPDAVKK